MRGIILAAIVAAGVGLVGTASVSAAPANGVTINDSANINDSVVKVQHWRWGSRGWRYRHWRGGWYRCHYRHRSWGRCWR